MTSQIILDADLSRKLREAGQTVELCDPAGMIMGKFVPLIDLSEWEALTPDISEEELDRIENANNKRYTTAEVLAHLEKL